jgi:DUF1680 family protein
MNIGIHETQVNIRQETDYPTSGNVRIMVDPEETLEFEIKLRIPLWCKEPSVLINNSRPEEKPSPGTFYVINRKWEKGDVIDLSLPMEYRFISGKGQQWQKVALMRGPVVYGISGDLNSWIAEDSEITIDPNSISAPATTDLYRPGGLSYNALLADDNNTPIIFTEFIDPTGIKTFFFLSDKSDLLSEDELVLKQY